MAISHPNKALSRVEVERRLETAPRQTKELVRRLREEAPSILKSAQQGAAGATQAIAARFFVSHVEARSAVAYSLLENRLNFFKRATKTLIKKNATPSSTQRERITSANIALLRSGDEIIYATTDDPKKRREEKYKLSGHPYCGRHAQDAPCLCSPPRPNMIALAQEGGKSEPIEVNVEKQIAYRVIPQADTTTP